MPDHCCPVWVGYLLANPLRKLFQNPRKLLSPHVKAGMQVLDVGCAMGFFSLPMAEMVGPEGRVICADVQKKMLTVLQKRAKRKGLAAVIRTHLCSPLSLQLDDFKGKMEFALAAAVVHEVQNADIFFAEIFAALTDKAQLFISEPKGHVSAADFTATIAAAERQGFELVSQSQGRFNREALFNK